MHPARPCSGAGGLPLAPSWAIPRGQGSQSVQCDVGASPRPGGQGTVCVQTGWPGTPRVGSGLCGGGVSVGAQRQRPRAGVLQEFADAVSQLVTQKFRELTAGLAAAHTHHRALAGIVMTTGNAARAPAGLPSQGEEPGSAGRGHHRALPSLRGPGRRAGETARRGGHGGTLTPPRGSAHAPPGLREDRRTRACRSPATTQPTSLPDREQPEPRPGRATEEPLQLAARPPSRPPSPMRVLWALGTPSPGGP